MNPNTIATEAREFVLSEIENRSKHERRWFENNFFDDGFHFKAISRKTGKVLDRVGATSQSERSIPRASSQIRGVINLLLAAEPYPVIYPDRVKPETFIANGQFDADKYAQAIEKNKKNARKIGSWLESEWKKNQSVLKIIESLVSAAKCSVSYIQVGSDPDEGEITLETRDAFDVILRGDLKTIEEQPMIAIVREMSKNEIEEMGLDSEKLNSLEQSTAYSLSDTKDAYMRQVFGSKKGKDTYIVIESYKKETLNDKTQPQAIEMSQKTKALQDKKMGDTIMRHTFSCADVVLHDEYVDCDEYPLVDFRFEPGTLYQTPFIERFISQNKALDKIMSRLEQWVNGMTVGVYQKRKGENFEVTNFAGGQIIEYETTPLTQMNLSSAGQTPFNVISLLDKYIEEQGASTAALGQIPSGVKSGVAIESLKSTEYANLKVATIMLKDSIKRVAELMLERAHKDFMQPVEVELENDGEPEYFDVIGKRGLELSQQVKKPLPYGIVPINKDTKVKIEIEPGLGLTMEGKRAAMTDIITKMIEMSNAGFVNKESLKIVIKRYLETFGFGSTQEFMEGIDDAGSENLSEEQITQMKVAIAEVVKELGLAGSEQESKLVESTKVGVLEALKDSGLLDKITSTQPTQASSLVESIKYKDVPEDIKRQIEAQAGLMPSQTTPLV